MVSRERKPIAEILAQAEARRAADFARFIARVESVVGPLPSMLTPLSHRLVGRSFARTLCYLLWRVLAVIPFFIGEVIAVAVGYDHGNVVTTWSVIFGLGMLWQGFYAAGLLIKLVFEFVEYLTWLDLSSHNLFRQYARERTDFS